MQTVNLKKGLDLNLKGAAMVAGGSLPAVEPAQVALYPDDFEGYVPRMAVKPGDIVASGDTLCTDKASGLVALTAPVAGTVTAVNRGERRKIINIVIKPLAPNARRFDTSAARKGDVQAIRSLLQASGLWAMMRQRPYDIVPEAASVPRDIMITAFDSAPLAPALLPGASAQADVLQAAADALVRLTAGEVILGVSPAQSGQMPQLKGVRAVVFDGPHPAGNPGVQIANLRPVNKGETVWTLDIATMWRIGHLLLTGETDYTTCVALTGSEIADPHMVTTTIGCDLESLLKGALPADTAHVRVISGNVLTGKHVYVADGYLRYPYRQITAIPEGDDADEFMGWASNKLDKMSESRSFVSHFLKGKLFSPDARLHGGRRAMIMSGIYDKMLPMDILPEYLIKAAIARDIDKMEQLGIYEVAPEDFALCEYADPSKLEIQRIIREALDYLRKELS